MTDPGRVRRGAGRGPAFAHASEAELARILDFYDVRWAYEPDTFPIGWNLDGDVVESFSPDFYLPDLELYVELTTLKQKLVRKKNRKLRRLRELYPDVRIKLFYARDFRMLLLKFGRIALHRRADRDDRPVDAAADRRPRRRRPASPWPRRSRREPVAADDAGARAPDRDAAPVAAGVAAAGPSPATAPPAAAAAAGAGVDPAGDPARPPSAPIRRGAIIDPATPDPEAAPSHP